MFKREEKLKTNSVIGKETELKGNLKDRESIRIDGKFEGEIEVGGNLIVGEDAVIKANIRAKSVSIGGKVVGDVTCEGKVELFSSGSLEGKVKASDLTIAEGAFFNGECRMVPLGELPRKESSKPPEKSKSNKSQEK
jgi:cytoskeletal protein CcmA (bactofilin family)